MSATARACFDRHRPYVLGVARSLLRKRRRFLEPLEAETIALGALWACALKHHAVEGEAFRHIAYKRVKGALADHARALDVVTRAGRRTIPHATSVEFDLDDAPSFDPSPEAAIDHARQLRAVRRAVCHLPPRLQYLVQRRYLDPSSPIPTLQIGTELGVSQPRITQLTAEAVALLRGRLGR